LAEVAIHYVWASCENHWDSHQDR